MDENKGLVRQRILIIVLILIMCGIVFGGYILLKEEPVNDNKLAIENTTEQVKNENNKNKVSNEVEENEEPRSENGITTEVNIIKDIENITDEELEKIVKKTLTEYLRYEGYEKSNIGPMPYLLVELGFETTDDIDDLTKGNPYTDEYIKSNTSYEKFKEALLQYVTEDYFMKYFSQYRNIDGKVAFCNCAGGGFSIAIEKVVLESKNDNKYKFEVTIKDLEVYDHYLEGEEVTEDDYLFEQEVEFEYVNERMVISKYNEQIILEGVYAMEASDVAYEFYKDGTVEYSTNMSVFKGVYNMCGENELRIDWEEKTEWDEITSEETVKKMSGREYVDVIDDKNIIVRTEVEGKTYKNEFVKFEN